MISSLISKSSMYFNQSSGSVVETLSLLASMKASCPTRLPSGKPPMSLITLDLSELKRKRVGPVLTRKYHSRFVRVFVQESQNPERNNHVLGPHTFAPTILAEINLIANIFHYAVFHETFKKFIII